MATGAGLAVITGSAPPRVVIGDGSSICVFSPSSSMICVSRFGGSFGFVSASDLAFTVGGGIDAAPNARRDPEEL